jgi:2-iminobutanoate/2-iminopropanoate deaminase
MVRLVNPSEVHTPAGNYSHTAVVPAASDLVFVSGQVAIRKDGTVPASFAEQAEVVFANLRSCLAEHGIGIDSDVKLNAYMVAGHDVHAMREVRLRYFGSHKPTSTAVFVPALVAPELLLEVEAIAERRSK